MKKRNGVKFLFLLFFYPATSKIRDLYAIIKINDSFSKRKSHNALDK